MAKKLEIKSEQQQKNEVAVALSQLFGAEVVPKDHFNKVNKERERLLKETQESEKLHIELAGYYCKFLSFKNYHSKWKPTTREIEKRTNKLASEKLIVNFDGIPQSTLENIEEAYKCYINGQEIAAYLMILRTVELTISELYDPTQNPNKDFVPAKKKLEWINKNFPLGAEYTIMKGYIEGRNEVIHNIHKPTEKQMMAAFETVKQSCWIFNQTKAESLTGPIGTNPHSPYLVVSFHIGTMIKFLNNITYELIGFGIFLVFGTFHFFTELGGAITGIVLTIVGIYYLTKMVVSFRHWKISKGASLINAHINFMLFATIFGTGFILLYLPGSTELIHSCLVLPEYTIVIFGIVMLIRRQKFNIYWELIRTNTMKWALSIVLCLILFYMFDMPTHLLEQGGPSHGWIKLY